MKLRPLKSAIIFCALYILFSPFLLAQSSDILTPKDKAALELYKTIGGESTAEAGAEAALAIQIKQNPKLAEYQDVFKIWFMNIFKSKNFKNEMIKIYSNHFTESELNELIKFYQTPIGQKTLKEFPILIQESVIAGQKEANDHSDELKTMLFAAMKQRHPELFKDKEN